MRIYVLHIKVKEICGNNTFTKTHLQFKILMSHNYFALKINSYGTVSTLCVNGCFGLIRIETSQSHVHRSVVQMHSYSKILFYSSTWPITPYLISHSQYIHAFVLLSKALEQISSFKQGNNLLPEVATSIYYTLASIYNNFSNYENYAQKNLVHI